jgi:hypothetical protein
MSQTSNNVILIPIFLMLVFTMMASKELSAQIWDHLITTKETTEYYIDPASIVKKENIVRYTQLINYPKGYDDANQNIHSIQQFKQINCKEELITTISMIAYSGINARGDILTLSVGRENKLLKINQNSISGLYRDEVCK